MYRSFTHTVYSRHTVASVSIETQYNSVLTRLRRDFSKPLWASATCSATAQFESCARIGLRAAWPSLSGLRPVSALAVASPRLLLLPSSPVCTRARPFKHHKKRLKQAHTSRSRPSASSTARPCAPVVLPCAPAPFPCLRSPSRSCLHFAHVYAPLSGVAHDALGLAQLEHRHRRLRVGDGHRLGDGDGDGIEEDGMAEDGHRVAFAA